jgi:hypothetical protein
MLAGFSKVGKTFAAIWLAQLGFAQNLIKGAFFFSLEDLNGRQAPRFTASLEGRNYSVFSSKMWHDRLSQEEEKVRKDTRFRALFLKNNHAILQLLHIEEGLLRKEGFAEQYPFKFMVFLNILREKIDEGFDFFVLDSLTSIFGNTGRISPDAIEALLKLPSSKHVTFIVIHHLSKKGDIYGPESIVKLFDTTYILEKQKEDTSETETVIKIVPKFDRFLSGGPFWIKRTRVNENLAQHEVLDEDTLGIPPQTPEKLDTLSPTIKAFIATVDANTFAFQRLWEYLKEQGKGNNRESAKNALRELEKDSIVKKVNGTWDEIEIVR